ncbi:MAG: dihydroneopterin aldolase [Silvanigrellaceae bacterium]
MNTLQNDNELCWIHIRDVYTFLYLGANPHEQKVGQNLKIDLSVQVPYRNTNDSLEKVVDYSKIIERVQSYIQGLGRVSLLEYLAEQLLDVIEIEFKGVRAARIVLYKAFVPLTHFTGSVAIDVSRQFHH